MKFARHGLHSKLRWIIAGVSLFIYGLDEAEIRGILEG